MPTFPFPRYNSQGNLTTQAPSVGAVAETKGQQLEQWAKAFGTAVEVGGAYLKALNVAQQNTSLYNFKNSILDIKQRSEQDTDYQNAKQRKTDIEKAKIDSLKGLSGSTKTQMETLLGYEANVANIEVDSIYKKKIISSWEVATSGLIENEIKNPKPKSMEFVKSLLDGGVNAGFITEKDAYATIQETDKKIKYNSFLSDLNADPASAEENLEKNTYDFDINEMEKAKSLYQTESKKIQAVTENDLLTRYLNGEKITTEEVRDSMNSKKVPASFADSMIEKINNPKPDRLSKDESYIDFQNKIVDIQAKGDKATTEEIVSIMADTMQAHAQGLLDKQDVDRILKDRNELLQKKLEKTAEDVMEKVQPKTLFQKLSFWSDEYADKKPEIKARMYRKLVDGISQGKDGHDVLRKVLDDEIDGHLAENLAKPDRQFAVNPETKDRVYSDDAGATWKDEKTGKDVK